MNAELLQNILKYASDVEENNARLEQRIAALEEKTIALADNKPQMEMNDELLRGISERIGAMESRIDLVEKQLASFPAIEARMVSLNQKYEAQQTKDVQRELTVTGFVAKLAALEEQIGNLEELQAEYEGRLDDIESRPAFAFGDEDDNDNDDVNVDEETGLPELEVEFIAEEETPEAEPQKEELVAEPVQEEAPAAPAEPASIVPKIADLKKAISLGDRFLFQRELFKGDGELYNRTLLELNALASLEEAEKYIGQFEWDKESNAYQLFYNLLKRRW